MTAVDEDTRVDLDWDLIMDETLPCDYCGAEERTPINEANWKATFVPCGHEHNACNMHRGIIMARFSARNMGRCQSTGIEITDIKWLEI